MPASLLGALFFTQLFISVISQFLWIDVKYPDIHIAALALTIPLQCWSTNNKTINTEFRNINSFAFYSWNEVVNDHNFLLLFVRWAYTSAILPSVIISFNDHYFIAIITTRSTVRFYAFSNIFQDTVLLIRSK